ncbi:MAG TPA: hypothetical protein VGF40_00795 [Thermoanaerobaculia bacterium]
MRSAIAVLLIAAASGLFAATGDVPLSPTLLAPLPGVSLVDVATSGSQYLVVYARGSEIYWQRVTAEGTAIDTEARLLDTAELAPGFFGDPIEVVWTGDAYLIVWTNRENAVVGQSIDRDGIVVDQFEVASDMSLYDVARWENEVAVLTSGGTGWRLTLLNAYGVILGVRSVSNSAAYDFEIVRLDEGWTVVGPSSEPGVVIVDTLTGSQRRVGTERRWADVHASPAGGALVVGIDDSFGVLRRDGSFVPIPLAIDRLSSLNRALIAPSPSGWAVIYRRADEARIQRVRNDGTTVSDTALSGPFPSRGSFLYHGIVAASVRDDAHFLLQPAPVGTTLGLESIGIAGALAYPTAPLAVAQSVQQWARAAHGPGVDFVVWIESGFSGWDIRATRVKDGAPLDGEGVFLGTSFPAYLDVAYDGEAFAIIWSDANGIFVQRVDLLGAILDPAPIRVAATQAAAVTAAGSGDGGLLLFWFDRPPAEPWRPTVALLRGGRVRGTAPIGSTLFGHDVEIGGSRDGFLAVFASPPLGCNFDPCIQTPLPVGVQFVTPQGIPSGPPAPITESMFAFAGKPESHGGEWFVPLHPTDGPKVIRLTGSGSSTLGRTATIVGGGLWGDLRSAPGGLVITDGRFRGMLNATPENVWYEPLPLESGEFGDALMAASEMVLVDTGTRYVLRPLQEPAAAADIALVDAGTTAQGGTTVRIEHRGGDDVPALHVEFWPTSLLVTSSRPIEGSTIDGPFKAGETIELQIHGPLPALVTVLPYAREAAAADNFQVLGEEPPPPPAKRRRLVGR